jgi:diguanylate cyclase (GGDEF)-like protein
LCICLGWVSGPAMTSWRSVQAPDVRPARDTPVVASRHERRPLPERPRRESLAGEAARRAHLPKRAAHRATLANRAAHRAPLRVLAIAAVTAAVVAIAGGGQAVWLCLPGALLAGATCRTTRGGAIGAALVVAAAAGAALARAGLQPLPSTTLIVLVPAGSVAVLIGVRNRLEAERDALRASALSDPLTGVANRRSLLERIDYEIARHSRSRRSFALVMLDLDGFKLLNDRFGHPAGDDLLRDVAAALGHVIRDQDTVARVGGDEFCVLAPETDGPGAEHLTGRVESAVARVAAGLDALGASAGAAVFPHDGTTAAALFEAADQRLLGVKRDTRPTRPRRRAA